MSMSVVYVGMDVHKDSIVIALAREGREAAENWKTIPNEGGRLREAGIDCIVVAPSLVPGKRRRQGAITRCGNGHLRKILVEGP